MTRVLLQMVLGKLSSVSFFWPYDEQFKEHQWRQCTENDFCDPPRRILQQYCPACTLIGGWKVGQLILLGRMYYDHSLGQLPSEAVGKLVSTL